MKAERIDTVRGYRLDFSSDTVYLNYTFAEKAQKDFLSAEAKRLREIKEAFPSIHVIVEAGRKITSTRPTKRLTYENMETYIGTMENSTALMKEFTKVKSQSKVEPSPYKFVRDWFETQFPEYKKAKVFQEAKKEQDAPAPESANVTEFPASEQENSTKESA